MTGAAIILPGSREKLSMDDSIDLRPEKRVVLQTEINVKHQSVFLIIGAILAVASLSTGCRSVAMQKEITAQRINIVDESGVVRLVIASELPDPVIRGEQLERSIVPAGLIWHDKEGNESGGLALAQVPQWKDGGPEGKVRMMTFDFTHQITDAVRVGTYESNDGDVWRGGLTVYDRRPYRAGPIRSSQGIERIFLGTKNQNAGLVIHDPEGRERIRIGVDSDGGAQFEILDESGETVYSIPEQQRSER